MEDIKVASYNCRKLPKSFSELHYRPDILQLFESMDIIAFQETWLAKQDLDLCNTLHHNFLSCSRAAVDYSEGILIGRPFGGVSLFYNKRLANYATPVYFSNCNWCVGVNILINTVSFTIINVYLPYECPDNEDEYIEKLSMLDNIIENINHSSYTLVGDFNANITSSSSKSAKYLFDFCERNHLTLSSNESLPGDSYTYISERWGSFSWLDHVASSADFHTCIRNINIQYDVTFNDHIPFDFIVSTASLPWLEVNNASNNNVVPTDRIDWRNISSTQKDVYYTFTDLHYNKYELLNSVPICSDCNCNNTDHLSALKNAYDKFTNSLILSGKKVCSSTRTTNTSRRKSIPGWSQYVKDNHDTAIDSYRTWRDNGKPRQGPIFVNYNRSKLNYKYAVRAVKRNAETVKADNAANKLCNNDYSGFWKAVSKFNNNNVVLPQQIGCTIGEKNICNKWKSHFSNVYNSVSDSSDNVFHKINVNHISVDSGLWFSDAQMLIALSGLKFNKSCGYDCIFAEHIKYCSASMLRFLCKLFNSFLSHGYLPDAFMSVMIKPIFKKGGSVCNWDSYRPIALANCLSKLYEALLRDKIYIYLATCTNQFGYKRKSGTDLCLYTFKQIIECYTSSDSNVYCCFLDASRAYDRVSHKKLFNMLVSREVPLIFIRILAYWYKFQTLLIKWGNCFSDYFTVSNGVRQGSLLSPYLFCIYVDNISERLNKTKIGCKVMELIVNHLFYADDLCLFSPSSRGLQILLNICHECASKLNIIFNESKCKIIVFKSLSYRNVVSPIFSLGQYNLDECYSYKYLGHLICNDLNDNIDINRQCRSIYARGNSLIRKFHRCSDDVKVTLFKSYCSSLYTGQLWYRYSQSVYRKINVAYHGVFKKFLNFPRSTSNSLLFVYYDVSTFQELIRKYVNSFRLRLCKSDNLLIVNLLNCNRMSSSCLNRRWFSLLN